MNFSTNSIIGLSIALGFFFIILPLLIYIINTFSSPKNSVDYDYSPESKIWEGDKRNSFSGQYADDAALSGIGGRKRNSKYKKTKGKKHYKNKK
jgi:hypothetical protein